MIRWFIVWFAVWCLRNPKLTEDDIRRVLTRAFPHLDVVWRTGVIEDAEARNGRRRRKARV